MRVSIMAGQFEPKLALREVGKHCARFPNHRSGPALEAWLLLRMNKPQDALSRLNRAETAIGLNDYGKALKVEALRGLGRDEEALDMTDMSTQDPSLPTVWLKETLQEAKSEEQMLSVATRVRGAGEKPEWVALYVAGWYGQHGQIEEAEDTLIAALEDQPFDPGLNRYLAGVEVRLNRANDAFVRSRSDGTRSVGGSAEFVPAGWVLPPYPDCGLKLIITSARAGFAATSHTAPTNLTDGAKTGWHWGSP